jgi:hypothetical protein
MKYKKGGEISSNPLFEHIESIGFEIETNELVKLTVSPNPFDSSITEKVLVNSALTNIDLEYGLCNDYEYANVIDEPTIKFKITNDSMEDDDFNTNLESIIDDECDASANTPFFKLNLIDNGGLHLQNSYDIFFKDIDDSYTPCSSFTDAEFIATYYKPDKTDNVILNYFFKTCIILKEHINSLSILTSTFVYEPNMEEDEENKEGGEIPVPNVGNQSYYLSVNDNGIDKEMIYLNISNNQNFNIANDLKFVPQLTFSCNVVHIYGIIIELMKLTNIQINTCNGVEPRCAQITKIQEAVHNITTEENMDMYAIQTTFTIANTLINDFNKSNKYGISFDMKEDDTQKIIMYLFLILYKTFIYINVFMYFKLKEEAKLLKKHLSFAVRHYNYDLYLNIVKIINNKYPDNNASDIINKIISHPIINQKMYFNPDIKTDRRKISTQLNTFKEQSMEKYNKYRVQYLGDPYYTILSYFKHFEEKQVDWLFEQDVDVKSSKLDLTNDLVIVEFRDFPTYLYLHLFNTGDENIKEQMLRQNVGTINMKIVNDYITLNSLSGNGKGLTRTTKKYRRNKIYTRRKGTHHKGNHHKGNRNKMYTRYKKIKHHKSNKHY